MIAVCRAFNWAEKMGHIVKSPLRGIEKPQASQRDQVISPEEYKTILKHVAGGFKDVLVTVWETGARPQEVTRVEAKHVDLQSGRWVFPVKRSKGKKRQRVVYLTDTALKIVKRLMKLHPTGPLYRNRNGDPWTGYAVSCGFTRLKAKVGTRYCLYAFRHSFITNGLKNGVDPVTIATLVGHADLKMIHTVYSHISQDSEFMRGAAMRAVK